MNLREVYDIICEELAHGFSPAHVTTKTRNQENSEIIQSYELRCCRMSVTAIN